MKEIFLDNVFTREGLSLLVKRAKSKDRLCIAVMASEICKDILAKFLLDRADFFRRHMLIATSGTASAIRSHVDLHIESVGHGPDGGDIVIANKILLRECDTLIFFRSGKEVLPHEEDIRTLLRVANMSNCIVATNIATANLVVLALELLWGQAVTPSGT